MRPVIQNVAAAANAQMVPVDRYINPISITVALVPGVGNDLTVQFTTDDVYAAGYNPAAGNWFPHPDMTNVIALQSAVIIEPITAVRVIRNGGDSGDAYRFDVIQAGNIS